MSGVEGPSTLRAAVRFIARHHGGLPELLAAAALLSLALIAALTLATDSARAAFPGNNGRIACGGALATNLPDPLPAGQSRLEIFDINPDGTDERRLTNDTASDASPDYSADGQKIVFNRDSQIWTMNADGSNQVGPLTTAPGSNTAGAWSPDGTKIAFQTTRHTGFSFDIYVMNADGTNQTRLTDNPAEDSLPSWSPDGTKIAFNSRRGGTPDLFVMNADGSAQTPVTDFAGEEAAANWSPDGRQLVFHTDRGFFPRPNVARNLEIYRINADGSGTPTRLTFSDFNDTGAFATDFTGFDLFPAWSPDGRRIVFHSGRAPEFRTGANNTAQWEAYTIDAVNGEGVGGNLVRLTNRAGNDERCNWQPIRAAQTPGTQYPVPYPTPPGSLSFAGCPSSSTNLVLGTPGNDVRNGTLAGDRIFVGTGNDRVDGLAGDDCIDLGPGTDVGQGALGDDLILGGLGNDRVSGSSGNDTLRGNPGHDRLNGGFGNDRLHGLAGRDRISGSRGRDRINGGSAGDVISGGSSGDRVAGDAGSDRINGNSGNDRISGNSGNDRLRGSSGRDRISGGSGRDRIAARDGQRDRINCGRGRDRVSADRIDIAARNCEVVLRAGANAATASNSLGLPALVGGAYVALLGWRRRP